MSLEQINKLDVQLNSRFKNYNCKLWSLFCFSVLSNYIHWCTQPDGGNTNCLKIKMLKSSDNLYLNFFKLFDPLPWNNHTWSFNFCDFLIFFFVLPAKQRNAKTGVANSNVTKFGWNLISSFFLQLFLAAGAVVRNVLDRLSRPTQCFVKKMIGRPFSAYRS